MAANTQSRSMPMSRKVSYSRLLVVFSLPGEGANLSAAYSPSGFLLQTAEQGKHMQMELMKEH